MEMCSGLQSLSKTVGQLHAVISHNLKGVAPPPPVQCWADINLMSGCKTGEWKYQEMVYYNRMHVKTRLSQSILSKIVAYENLSNFHFDLSFNLSRREVENNLREGAHPPHTFPRNPAVVTCCWQVTLLSDDYFHIEL